MEKNEMIWNIQTYLSTLKVDASNISRISSELELRDEETLQAILQELSNTFQEYQSKMIQSLRGIQKAQNNLEEWQVRIVEQAQVDELLNF